jgi:hypothetical protein
MGTMTMPDETKLALRKAMSNVSSVIIEGKQITINFHSPEDTERLRWLLAEATRRHSI